MKTGFSINYSKVEKNLNVAISKVQRGTKKATTAECIDILKDSKKEVPSVTGTLKKSAFYEIHGSYKNFTATVGYGGNGDPVNPKTGEKASSYMVAVHEDLEAEHEKGKAKFLEDPVRRHQSKFAPRVALAVKNELGG